MKKSTNTRQDRFLGGMDDHAETIVVAILKRRENPPAEVVSVAERAEVRLHRKFRRMENQNKRSTITAVAVARELAGFSGPSVRSHD